MCTLLQILTFANKEDYHRYLSQALCATVWEEKSPGEIAKLCYLYLKLGQICNIFYMRHIHQFDISGLSFTTGSWRELGVKELCQLHVYNSIARVMQSSVFEI